MTEQETAELPDCPKCELLRRIADSARSGEMAAIVMLNEAKDRIEQIELIKPASQYRLGKEEGVAEEGERARLAIKDIMRRHQEQLEEAHKRIKGQKLRAHAMKQELRAVRRELEALYTLLPLFGDSGA